MTTLTSTFHDRAATERAIDDLTSANIPRDDISVVMSNDTRNRYFNNEENVHGANIANGAAGGGVLGGSLGAIAGGFLIGGTIAVATGGLAAPFLIAGPIAGALAGGGAGAAVGSIIGALVGAGIPEAQASAIENEVKHGGVILAVRTDDARIAIARAVLARDGGIPTPEAAAAGSGRGMSRAETLREDTMIAPTDVAGSTSERRGILG